MIRELIANAVLHRTYVNAEASPITVAIYDDRLEITSPGKLKRGVTVEKMLEGCSDCRNEALALALSNMNIIEDWGSGIPRIRRMLKDAGLRDLVIEDWPNAVRVVVYRPVSWTSAENVRPESHSLASRILNALVSEAKNRSDIAYSLGQKSGSGQFKKVIVELLTNGMIERTIPDKPNSRLQKYRLTEKGRKMVSC